MNNLKKRIDKKPKIYQLIKYYKLRSQEDLNKLMIFLNTYKIKKRVYNNLM